MSDPRDPRALACRGCGERLPPPFLDLGSTPLANRTILSEHESVPEPRFPLSVVYCGACHLVQLTHTVDPETLFEEYLYFSSYSATFLEHARRMSSDMIDRFGLGPESRVLEIASNDGYLLRNFVARNIPSLGIEPAKNIADRANRSGIPTWNRFFGPDLVEEVRAGFGPPDLIIGNNVLAHVPEICAFLDAVGRCLAPSGVAVFEVPSLRALLERTEFDTIYHEHVFYLSLSALANLAARAGVRIFDVSIQEVHGQSLRVFLARGGEHGTSPNVPRMLEAEVSAGLTGRDRYVRFEGEVRVVKKELLETLARWKKSGKRLAAYGAPAKGSTLLNTCGIGTDLLDFTVDKNPHKQGRLMPGVRIPILAPETLVERMPDYALILPWNIADEIVSQQAEYVRRGGRFIVPIPRLAEIGGPPA